MEQTKGPWMAMQERIVQDRKDRLIAAAPELLAALKEFFEVIHGDCGEGDCQPCKLAREAIAKAEGR